MKMDMRLLLALLLVFCVPLVHSLLSPASGDVAGADPTYSCNNTGTTPKVCGTVGNPPCLTPHTICKGQAETGNTIYCHDGTGAVDTNCVLAARQTGNCTADNDAETHSCP